MAIRIHYPSNSKGAQLLEQTLASASAGKRLRDLDVSWGQITSGSLNAMPRLGGYEQLEHLRAANSAHFKVPEFTSSLRTAQAWARARVPVFGRLNSHTAGKDIVTAGSPQAFARRDYWVKVVQDVRNEWRIHVFGGKCIARGLKHYAGSRREPGIIRSRRKGWRLRHDVEPSDAIREAARAAVAACGYDFGAVDLLERSDGSIWVLEVNKQPGLDNYTAGQYAKALVKRASAPGTPRT